jgi:hypothetical protein
MARCEVRENPWGLLALLRAERERTQRALRRWTSSRNRDTGRSKGGAEWGKYMLGARTEALRGVAQEVDDALEAHLERMVE